MWDYKSLSIDLYHAAQNPERYEEEQLSDLLQNASDAIDELVDKIGEYESCVQDIKTALDNL